MQLDISGTESEAILTCRGEPYSSCLRDATSRQLNFPIRQQSVYFKKLFAFYLNLSALSIIKQIVSLSSGK